MPEKSLLVSYRSQLLRSRGLISRWTLAPRALDIPELLQHIVSFLERRDLACAAQVSQYWSELALSALWEHLPELMILVRVLHPLRWSEENECWVREIHDSY